MFTKPLTPRQRRARRYHVELVQLLTGITDPNLMGQVLDDLLTPAELREVAKRVQIFKLLNKRVDQRTIADQLEVGIATVTRGSRVLLNPASGFRKIIKQL